MGCGELGGGAWGGPSRRTEMTPVEEEEVDLDGGGLR